MSEIPATSSRNFMEPFSKKYASLNVPVCETTKAVFSKIAYGDRTDGALAVCMPKRGSFKDFVLKKFPLFVLVESVEKPGNLGAILRTCDGAGIDGVIVCDAKTDLFNPNVIRASLGTVFSVKTVACSNAEALKFLRSKDIKICATSPRLQAPPEPSKAWAFKAWFVAPG